MGLKGWSDNESGASGQAVNEVLSSFQWALGSKVDQITAAYQTREQKHDFSEIIEQRKRHTERERESQEVSGLEEFCKFASSQWPGLS